MDTTIAAIIPALNEEQSLPFVLGDLPSHIHAVVVDNGSVDRTSEVALAYGATVVFESTRGYGSAVLAGIRALADNPPTIAVILDADYADRPDLVGYLTEPIAAGHVDMVLSDRTKLAEKDALTPAQRFGNLFACRLMRAVTGHRYRDMGPFRAIRWDALMTLEMSDPTWGWNVEMQIKAIRRGLRVVEVSMPYRCRVAGVSKISGDVIGAVRAGSRILWAVRQYRKG